jgi:hypothetical protein
VQNLSSDAIRCKHCHSDLPAKPSADKDRLLAEFERFTYLNFDENNVLCESRFRSSDIGLRYLDAVRRSGDKATAEKRLLRKIDELAMFNNDVAEQFYRLVSNTHRGWLWGERKPA